MSLISDSERRRAFSTWLRTGKLPRTSAVNGVEVKSNPWHDPVDGRFTFAGSGQNYGQSGSRRFRVEAGERAAVAVLRRTRRGSAVLDQTAIGSGHAQLSRPRQSLHQHGHHRLERAPNGRPQTFAGAAEALREVGAAALAVRGRREIGVLIPQSNRRGRQLPPLPPKTRNHLCRSQGRSNIPQQRNRFVEKCVMATNVRSTRRDELAKCPVPSSSPISRYDRKRHKPRPAVPIGDRLTMAATI